MGYGNFGYGNMMGYGGFGFGWIFSIIFWALIIWAIVALVRAVNGKGGSSWMNQDKEDSAMKILKERYAKGEISKEEFEQKRKDIENVK
jgi:putative membrane protein